MCNADYFKHELSLYLKFEVLNLSIVIIFKVVHWLKNDESYSVISNNNNNIYFVSQGYTQSFTVFCTSGY